MLDIFHAALAGARTLATVDDLAKALWTEFAAGRIGEAETEAVAGRIEDRRREIRPKDRTEVRAPQLPRIKASFFPPKRRIVSPDRAASRDRRRRLACSGPMPAALAYRYTVGQLAVLRIVADEVRARGLCALPLGAIAARAGVGMTTARDAIRLAAGDGLLVIQERRQSRAPNLPNVVRVISREWISWIRRSPLASKISGATDTNVPNPYLPKPKESGLKSFSRREGSSLADNHDPQRRRDAAQ